jgi:serine protease
MAATLALIAISSLTVLHADERVTFGGGEHLPRRPFEVAEPDSELAPAAGEYRPDEIIVKFDPNVPEEQRAQIAQAYGCQVAGACQAGLQLVRLPAQVTPHEMALAFDQRPDVIYAEPNPIARAVFVPDDSYYTYQWNLDNGETRGIHMEEAWAIEQGRPEVIVAVLDTGVAYEDYDIYRQAPDLVDTLFVPGYDFVNDDEHPNDDQGHGTHVAGTIGQSTNNGMGVAGIAPGCSIMPVKVLDQEGAGDHFTIARAIRFAVNGGARVINLSLGSPQPSNTLRDAVRMAYENGVTIVSAAGNDYLKGNPTFYPAAEKDYCIAVGAIRYDSKRSPYSNTGFYMSVVAPGGDVSVDQNMDDYADGILQQTFVSDPGDFHYYFFQGTSMAAPHVSGLAALLASHGVTDPDRIREAIEQTARDLGPSGWDEQYGWGLIDAGAALRYFPDADMTGDAVVDLDDLIAFSQCWLATDELALACDFNGDGRVDLRDFSTLADRWV